MKYQTAAAFRTALERRLLERSRDSGTSLVRLRKAVVFDRLLARLLRVALGRWVLKGALALDFRMGEGTRTTKDMDLVRKDDEESATADLIACQSIDLDDFFAFVVEKASRITEEQDGGAVRYRVRCEVAGRLFENVIVDIGFSDSLAESQPDLVSGSNLLSFAGIDSITIPILPLEQHVAEKIHAYTRRYGDGRSSSRVKDLVDLVLIKQSMTLDATRLQSALIGIFERRRHQELPQSLPPPPSEWKVAYRKLAADVGTNPELAAGYREASDLLNEILAGRQKGSWDPVQGQWV